MPIALDPNNTTRVSLDYDVQNHPDERTRPAFIVSFPTSRQRTQIHEIFRAHDAESDPEKKTQLLIDAAKVIVRRWENIEGMTWENMPDKLTAHEIDELTTKMLTETLLTEIERGKSVSAQQSAGDSSAPTAAKMVAA